MSAIIPDQPLTRTWFGTLTTENVEAIAARIREILAERFVIAEALYCDSERAELRLISADCSLDSEWTSEPRREPVRVFHQPDHVWLGFSAGGYLWSFTARSDGKHDHDNYRYPYFNFDSDKFTVTDRAPAGKGYLHKRVFGAHNKNLT